MGVNKITAFNFAQEDNLSIDRDKLKEKLITIKLAQGNMGQAGQPGTQISTSKLKFKNPISKFRLAVENRLKHEG